MSRKNGIATKATPAKTEKGILASAAFSTQHTNVIAEDLYKEPTKSRLDSGQVWVRMFDLYSGFLLNLMSLVNYSPTLRRIINDKTSMCVGDGFIAFDGQPNTLIAGLQRGRNVDPTDSRLLDLDDFIQSVNLHGETLVDVLSRVFWEFDAFGNAVVEIVQAGDASYLYCVPMYQVGLKKAGPDQLVRSIGVYEEWSKVDLNRPTEAMPDGFRELPIYPEWSVDDDGVRRTAIHIKQYASGYFYFGLPEWISAVQWVEMEYRIGKFNINEFENGFNLSGIVQLFGSVSTDEAQDIIGKMQDKFTNTGNARKWFFQILRDERLKANVQSMAQDIHEGHFTELQRLAAQNIVAANRWTMSLAGWATEGKLGTNQQIRQETEYVQNTVVKPRQNLVLSRIVTPYLEESAQFLNAPWAGISFGISNNIPVSFMGDIDVEANLRRDEKRELLGYEPDEAESVPDNSQNTQEDEMDAVNIADTTLRRMRHHQL